MSTDPLTLRFDDPEMERRFLERHSELAARSQRQAAVLGVFLYAAGIVWIRWIHAPTANVINFFILFLGVPTLFATFAASFVRTGEVVRQAIGLTNMFAAEIVVISPLFIMSANDDTPLGRDPVTIYQFSGFPLLFVVLLVTYTFVRLRFVFTLFGTVLFVAIYVAAAVATGVSTVITVNNTVVLSMMALMGNAVAYFIESFLRGEFVSAERIAEEQRRAERLLLNVLPATIAERLKNDERPIADSFSDVTVLFADIVGFTEMSSRVEPDVLVEFLNGVFSHFDRAAERHGLEKIKTIGDAYMVAGGLPIVRADHAEAVAEMALEMRETAQGIERPDGKPLELRIGVHTGPAVAGVIGARKFIYDVWGDTVNVASRMEAHGLTGQIHVSRAAFEQLQGRYDLVERGSVAVKGKGDMQTYLLMGRAAELTSGAVDRAAG